MTLMESLKKKQKADAARREARLEKRREYAKAACERELALQNGLTDLPPLVALAIEELPAKSEPTPAPVKPDASPAELVARLEAIKERIFRLRALFAVSLSQDCAIEADRFLAIFQALSVELKNKDPQALDKIIVGHEAMLSSPPIQIRQSIPLDTQRLCELRWEVSRAPVQRVPKRPIENIPDGLSWML
jgi:hypothetical protein